MIQPIYLAVDGKHYYNELLARFESFQSGKPIEFNCYTQENALLDWSQEPTNSMDDLMLEVALELRNKVEYLILSWSGGTDSQTIYNIFVRNNIHIDEIVIWHDDDHEGPVFPKKYADWMIKNHPDPTTVISPRYRFDPDAKRKLVNSEDWLWQNTAVIARVALGMGDVVMQEYCQQQANGRTWCLVNGHEQPEVYSENDLWYARHNPRNYRSIMGFDNSISFFTQPKLALKQAHLAKKALRALGKTKMVDGGWSFGFSNAWSYQAWSRGIGRHPELFPGHSWKQKAIEGKIDYLTIAPDTIDGDLTASEDRHLSHLIQQDHQLASVFQKGIRNILSERNFCRHLIETSNRHNISIIGKNVGEKITSKQWCLGK
jgi:hypothetical protein